MRPDRKRGRSAVISRMVGAMMLGGALLVVAGGPGHYTLAAANPGMSPTPAPPAKADPSNKSDKPKSDEDHHRNSDPNWDVLEGLGGLNVGGPGRRPGATMPAAATGAGTAGDEAAANDAVAAAAAARAAKPKSNIDMPEAMRAERCENNRRRIAELERQLAQIWRYKGALNDAEDRSERLFHDLPASSAQYVLARDDVKRLKAFVAPERDLQSQLAWHKSNLVALGC